MTVSLGAHGVLRWVSHGVYLYWCAGCKKGHTFDVTALNEDGKRVGWDGDHLLPTVAPDMVFPGCKHELRAGVLKFHPDCTHELAGKNVPLQEYPLP